MASYHQRNTGRQDAMTHNKDEPSNYWPHAEVNMIPNERWEKEIRSGENFNGVNRLRSHTMSSATSFYAASNSDGSYTISRPPSTFDSGPSVFESDKRENPAKALLSKGGRMLRKHGSKFSLSSLYLDSEANDKFFTRPVTANSAVEKKNMGKGAAAALRREELKRAISDPFDFQHVTHTDRVYLNSLERVPKTELISEFSALRAGQRAKPQLRGIRADDLPTMKQPSTTPPDSPTVRIGSVSANIPNSPLNPARPVPPPKDTVPFTPAPPNPRYSRSLDNFSLPRSVPSTPMTPPTRYSSRGALQSNFTSINSPLRAYVHSPSHDFVGEDEKSTEDLCQNCDGACASFDKPLPGMPSLYDGSTDHNGARCLRASPLSENPPDIADVPEENKIQRRPLAAPQAPSPSSKHSVSPVSPDDHRCNSLGDLYDSYLMSPPRPSRQRMTGIPSPVSSLSSFSDTLFEQERLSKHRSIGLKMINVDDWEGAIDDSWDELNNEVNPGASSSTSLDSMTSRNEKIVDSSDSISSRESTTPDAQAYMKAQRASKMLMQFQGSNVASVVKKIDEPSSPTTLKTQRLSQRSPRLDSSPILGLRTESRHSQQAVREGPSSTMFIDESSHPHRSESNLNASYISNVRAQSGVSKSSSQESIILSIASSIMGTQRSSMTSASLLELMPDYTLAKRSIDDFKEALETLAESLQGVQEDDVMDRSSNHKSYPSALPRKTGQTPHRRVQSLAKDFVVRDSPRRSVQSAQTSANNSNTSTASIPRHQRVPSGSRIPIPARKSSVSKPPSEQVRPPARHLRSATTTSLRSRSSSRVSYSLFPTGASTGAGQ